MAVFLFVMYYINEVLPHSTGDKFSKDFPRTSWKKKTTFTRSLCCCVDVSSVQQLQHVHAKLQHVHAKNRRSITIMVWSISLSGFATQFSPSVFRMTPPIHYIPSYPIVAGRALLTPWVKIATVTSYLQKLFAIAEDTIDDLFIM